MKRSPIALFFPCFVMLSSLAACAGPLSSAKGDFKAGRYAEAKAELVPLEADARDFSDDDRAAYALYRGLTHDALGDRAAALMWLGQAKAIEDARPGTLSADDRARLTLGLESLGPDAAPTP